MKRNARTTKTKARALTQPQPSFVSMVKAGANQRPYRAVKMDGVAQPTSDATEEDTSMTKKTKSVTVPQGFDIVSLHFSGTAFPDEPAVKAWLDAGGYENYQITTKEDGSFSVDQTEVTFEEGTTQKVEGAVDGLTVYVGKVAGEAVTEKSDEEVAAEAATSNPSSVQPVAATAKSAEDADAATAEGSDDEGQEPENATKEAEGNTDMAEALSGLELTIKGMYEVSTLGDVLRVLKWIVEDAPYDGTSEAVIMPIKDAAASLIVALGAAMSDTVAVFEAAFKSILDKDTANPVTSEKTETTDDEAEDATAPEEIATEEPTEAPAAKADWEVAFEGLTKMVGTLTEEVKVLTSKSAPAEEGEERVERVEITSQTRKGSDASGNETAADTDTETKAKQDAQRATQRLRSALGSQFIPADRFKD